MFLSYEFLLSLCDDDNYGYDRAKAKRYALVIKKCKSQRKSEKFKIELFKLMHVIIVKNVRNFYWLEKFYKDKLYTEDELVSEFYIVFNRCCELYDPKHNFYTYLNKSLTWRSQRIIDRQHKKLANTVKSEGIIDFHGSSGNDAEFLDFEMSNFGLSGEEIDIVKSRVRGDKISDYLDEKDMDSNEYYKHLTNIKNAIQNEFTNKTNNSEADKDFE